MQRRCAVALWVGECARVYGGSAFVGRHCRVIRSDRRSLVEGEVGEGVQFSARQECGGLTSESRGRDERVGCRDCFRPRIGENREARQTHRIARCHRNLVRPIDIVVEDVDFRGRQPGWPMNVVHDGRCATAVAIVGADPLVGRLDHTVAAGRTEDRRGRVRAKVADDFHGRGDRAAGWIGEDIDRAGEILRAGIGDCDFAGDGEAGD